MGLLNRIFPEKYGITSSDGAWEYWSRVDSIKEGALREALIADTNGLTLVSALVLTNSLPALLIKSSDCTDSIDEGILSYLHYGNTIMFAVSAY